MMNLRTLDHKEQLEIIMLVLIIRCSKKDVKMAMWTDRYSITRSSDRVPN